MNIYESQPELENNKTKTKKLMIIIGVAIVILFVLSIGLIFYISYIEKNKFKCYIDGTKISTKSDMIVVDENKNNIYVSLEDIASQIGYAKNNGEYKNQYTEDFDKCYLQNKYEAVSYITDSNQIYKTILSASQGEENDYKYFEIDEPVIISNNKMYTTIKGISKGCNLDYSYDPENNTLKIYTMDYLNKMYASKLKIDGETVKLSEEYSDQKAIFEGLIIVIKNNIYGVVDVESGNPILEFKYEDIKYLPATSDFLVKSNNKYGVIGKDTSIKVRTVYDEIKIMDNQNELYLVKQNNLYGVIDTKGKTIISPEYKQIGIDISYPAVVIPSYQVIIVEKDKHYNIITTSGEELIPTYVLETIYLKTNTETGENTFYMAYNNNEKVMSVEEWLASTGR